MSSLLHIKHQNIRLFIARSPFWWTEIPNKQWDGWVDGVFSVQYKRNWQRNLIRCYSFVKRWRLSPNYNIWRGRMHSAMVAIRSILLYHFPLSFMTWPLNAVMKISILSYDRPHTVLSAIFVVISWESTRISF